MSIMEFSPNPLIKPLFGIKLSPVLQRVCESVEAERAENLMLDVMKINSHRVIQLKKVEDVSGNFGMILIIYNHIYIHKKPETQIPEKDGFFDFKIYELDFNKDIDIEFLIEESDI